MGETRSSGLSGPQLDEWPPDCADHSCKACRECFAIYVQLKWEGALD